MQRGHSKSNSSDKTLERNYHQKWRFLMEEYELVQSGQHQTFQKVGEFYKYHGTCSQTFRKYYNRFLAADRCITAVEPQKRGPKWKTRRTPASVEKRVLDARELGNNRYEIAAIMREDHAIEIAPSTVYRICQRHGKNRITPAQTQEKRRIMREKLGDLGHVDLHHLPKDSFIKPLSGQYYIVGVIDTCSRIAWAEVVETKQAVPVAFTALKIFNTINHRYGVQFKEILSDNGSEVASRTNPHHPFEFVLNQLGVKHLYTRPYRPQTNGKIERFWRTLNDDLINGTTFEDMAHFKQELLEYLLYYNEFRPHQALNHKTPSEFAKNLK